MRNPTIMSEQDGGQGRGKRVSKTPSAKPGGSVVPLSTSKRYGADARKPYRLAIHDEGHDRIKKPHIRLYLIT